MTLVALLAALALVAAGCGKSAVAKDGSDVIPAGIHRIKHVIVIMQENRSFDNYFGTYPGAVGFARDASGKFTACLPSKHGRCKRPYHDAADINGGAAHALTSAEADIDHGKMDGFVKTAETSFRGCPVHENPICAGKGPVDVMGYHDAREIPNYWKYANDFVLQDHMFASSLSWSLTEHLFIVSGWAAKCSSAAPSSCKNDLAGSYKVRQLNSAARTGKPVIDFSWTDLTYLLRTHHVSWRYYVEKGLQPDCADDAERTCPRVGQDAQTPGIWNPLPLFVDVKQAGQLVNVQDVSAFQKAAATGTLPSVSWIVPNGHDSEHPPGSVKAGQAWVTGLINDVMRSPDWNSTAIFLSWDDWGGFYDNVNPPRADANGYGIRVPGLVISPYARRGYVDHQVLSHDAYLKFIEDDFLDGLRLDPKTDGRPDPRPTVREDSTQLGNLVNDFDFNQAPRKPVVLPLHPPPGPASRPG